MAVADDCMNSLEVKWMVGSTRRYSNVSESVRNVGKCEVIQIRRFGENIGIRAKGVSNWEDNPDKLGFR